MTAPVPAALDAAPFGFAVLRTPLLPCDELARWSAGLESPHVAGAGDDAAGELAAALARDRERLRARLVELVDRPEVREALFLASPSLLAGLEHWRRDPDGKKGRRAEDSLVRYLLRMTTRPTPFGVFSGCSLLDVGEETRLRLAPRGEYRRRSRLDMGYLFRLQEDLGADRALRRALRWRPNSSLYRAAGRLRFAEARWQGQRRIYHLVAVEPEPFVELVLRDSRGGATIAELVRRLVAADPDGEVEAGEAEEFLHELIDGQLLVSDLAPVITGGEALDDLVATLRTAGAPAVLVERLEAAGAALAGLDRGGLGAPPRRYREVAATLEALPTAVELPRLFQVDMIKPAPGATLGREVVDEIARGVALLARLGGRSANDEALARFRQAFVERWGADRAVPLVEALDEEAGIGFDRDRGADLSPLLEGLDFPPAPGAAAQPRWGAVEERLAALAGRALERGETVLDLAADDLGDLAGDDEPPLCDAFEVMATVAAASQEALAAGDFRVLLRGGFGPSGARLLSRFCHADPALAARVAELVAAEERLEPDVDFAEVVHLPEGRIGNIVSRPVLRGWEIPFLGRSGAAAERQLPVGDLLVAVAGDTVVLRSARSGRRVVPRLTTAHNFTSRGMGIYRFLGALQSQHVRAALTWRWGPLEALPFLPRVTSGRLVLARARWALSEDEIRRLQAAGDAERCAAVRALRRERGVPRWVVFPEGDNELVVDLDNPLAVDALAGRLRGLSRASLLELLPAPGELCAEGPEGRFTHEVLVPFVRRREPSRSRLRSLRADTVRRTFPPGSEWLYAKLYTGTGTADRVLRHLAARVVRPALASGAAARWFFLRYGDPDFHLRLRLQGDPKRQLGEVLPALEEAAAPLLADGQLWRLELGTYEREVERYGGAAGALLAERVFHADSEAVLAVLEQVQGEDAADLVWRLAVAGLDRLLADLGLAGDGALAVLDGMQRTFAREHRADARLKKQMSDRLRREQPQLEALLAAGDDPAHPLAPVLAAFRRRSEALAPVVAELRRAAADGRLELPLAELAPSFAHMFVNRLLRSDNRAHELVLYDFLLRLTQARLMRERALAGSAP